MDPSNPNCGFTALMNAVSDGKPPFHYNHVHGTMLKKEKSRLNYYQSALFRKTHKGICLRRTMGLPEQEFARFMKTQELYQIERWLFIQKKLNYWIKQNPADHDKIQKWTWILEDHMETQYEATLHPSVIAMLNANK